MNSDQMLVLGILIVAIAVFATDKLRVDVVALIVLVMLALTGLVSAEEAFAGLSNPAVITVIAIFILSAALVKTGVADFIAKQMLRVSGSKPHRVVTIIMVTCGFMSAVMNNIGAAAILLPAVLMISRQTDISPSKLLIPLAFSSLLGGNMTAIGTPPNILANGILQRYPNLEPFGFFDFLPTGGVVLVVGIVYMGTIGYSLLPSRAKSGGIRDDYPAQDYLSTVVIRDDSAVVGQSVESSHLDGERGLRILSMRRTGGETFVPRAESVLRAHDTLIVQGDLESIAQFNDDVGGDEGDSEVGWTDSHPERNLSLKDIEIVEVMVAPNSELVGQSLRQADFRNDYDLVVLALGRRKETRSRDLGQVKLQVGDTLMVTGSAEKLSPLGKDPNFIPVRTPEIKSHHPRQAIFSVVVMAIVLSIASLKIQPISIAMLAGALVLVVSGILSMEEAYDAVDWKAVFLITGMLPLGTAMQNTGTATLLAETITHAIGGYGPHAVLLGIYGLTVLITSVISNAAATVLIVPIAIDAALGIEVSPYPFVMATVIAASTSFLLPIGHQVNVLVYGPGHYRFTDFARAGVGLTLLIMVLVGVGLPLVWPF